VRSLRSLPEWQRNLWTIIAVEILTLLAFNASAILIPYHVQNLGLTDRVRLTRWTGAYQSVGSITFAIATPIWGLLGDRFGRKAMLLRATSALGFVLLGMIFCQTPSQLMALRVLQGAMTGTPAAAAALLASGTPKEHAAYALGLLQAALYVGISLGPMMGGYIGDAFGYRTTFGVSLILVVLALILIVAMVREPRRRTQAADGALDREPRQTLPRRLLSAHSVGAILGLTLLVNVGSSLVNPVMPLYVQQLAADPSRLASITGTIAGTGALAAAISALVVGKAGDRIGRSRAMLACLAGAACASFMQAMAHSPLALGIWSTVVGLSLGGFSPSVSAELVSRISENRIGTVLGLNSSASSIGFGAGPLIGAWVMSHTSAPTVYRTTALVLGLMAAGLVGRELKGRRQRRP